MTACDNSSNSSNEETKTWEETFADTSWTAVSSKNSSTKTYTFNDDATEFVSSSTGTPEERRNGGLGFAFADNTINVNNPKSLGHGTWEFTLDTGNKHRFHVNENKLQESRWSNGKFVLRPHILYKNSN